MSIPKEHLLDRLRVQFDAGYRCIERRCFISEMPAAPMPTRTIRPSSSLRATVPSNTLEAWMARRGSDFVKRIQI